MSSILLKYNGLMKATIQIVVVAIIRDKNKYLLTKRYEPTISLTHEVWQFPGGGLEAHETVLDCLHREVREEVGLKIRVISPAIVHDNIIKEWNN